MGYMGNVYINKQTEMVLMNGKFLVTLVQLTFW